MFGWAFALLMLALIVVAFVAGLSMTRYMFEDRLFLDSFKSAWRDVWFGLQFLPLVGHWFEPKRDPREALEEDEPGGRPPPVE